MDSPGYEVGFPSQRAEEVFAKAIRKIPPKERLRISEGLDRLATSPRSQSKSFKSLKGVIPIFGYLAQYRLRVGDYRILYDVDDARRKVILLAIRRRNEQTYD